VECQAFLKKFLNFFEKSFKLRKNGQRVGKKAEVSKRDILFLSSFSTFLFPFSQPSRSSGVQ
jgi:hypothetical protein